jgi:hypothetical protein
MTLRYRMNVARHLLADWEQAADRCTLRDTAAHVAEMSLRFDMLTEWLDVADLNGSTFDPTSPLYLATDHS